MEILTLPPVLRPVEVAELLAEQPNIRLRGRAEWEAGHLPSVKNIPVGYLTDHLEEIPRDKPVVVHCQSGARSAIAASLLGARGLTNVVNLTGGFADWQKDGHPVERGVAAEELVESR